ncbi:hypothetical protein [Dyadobacter sandarakinus]|uniref:FecR protein domain-containing protein n=1 Tax=Dyadobacter sandarakinus TaxID=2747268 RepID=A0ABX7I4S4_9BACT|nr:hypothetical protein [Dyadobacter sandarakinus]QRR00507.1 hypothetical protein HWI92_06085 [Dyadobacter sandarakinus]
MKTLISSLLVLCCMANAAAQVPQKTYRIKNGTKASEVIPYDDRFQYQEFTDGQVFFRNGRTGRAKLNYSLLHGEVMFIGPVNDTLLLTNNDFIHKIEIGSQAYYFNKGRGHIELIGDYGNVSLGKKLLLVRAGNEKLAAYNQYTETSSIDTFSSFINHNGDFQFLQGSDKLILHKRELFFLMDRNAQFHFVNRASIGRLYPGHKREIESFIKINGYDLEREKDLRQVLDFCSTL